MKPEFLFIEYANADLRKNPEFLLKISEYLDRHYYRIHEKAGHVPWSEQHLNNDDIVYFNKPVGRGCPDFEAIVKKLLSVTAASCRSYKGGLGTQAEFCACEGAFYWAMHDHGCDECQYNWPGQREVFHRDGEIPCFVCDWLAFKEVLRDKAAGKDVNPGFHDLLQAYNELKHKETVIRKKGFLEDFEYLSLNLNNQDWLIAPQRFSQIVMAVLMDDIRTLLTRDRAKSTSPEPTDLIKQCRICGKFFIAPKSDSKNCADCTGKETQKAWRERQQKHRYNKNIEYSKLYDRGIKFGLNHAEVESRLEYWINESGCKFSDVRNLPDTTLFSFKE
jgi:hypothetical protein